MQSVDSYYQLSQFMGIVNSFCFATRGKSFDLYRWSGALPNLIRGILLEF